MARTHIGYGSPHKQDTWHAHGEPLGVEETRLTKRALDWPQDRTFYVPDEAFGEFRKSIARGAELEAAWRRRMDDYRVAQPIKAAEFARALAGELPPGWNAKLTTFTSADGGMATREAGGQTLNALGTPSAKAMWFVRAGAGCTLRCTLASSACSLEPLSFF